MANNNETTTKFKVDISELKKNFQEASRQIRLANSEFKAATAGMDKWSTSADGISAKLKQLDSVLDAQKKQLQSLSQQYAEVVAEQGENSQGAEELRIKINNQRAAIGETEKQIRNYNDKLTEMQSATQEVGNEQTETKTAMEKLKDTINQQEQDLSKLKEQYSNLIIEQGEGSQEAQNLAQQIGDLSTELQENRDKLNSAEEAADEFDNTLEDVDESADDTANGGLKSFTIALGNLISDGIKMAIGKLKDLASETINVGKEFDKSMSNVAALSGATDEELEMLRDTAKEYGATTQFSASEAADALGYMALAGWDANQSADALGGVLDLAASSGMGLADASDMVTDYLSAFSMEADESTYFADVLAYAQANANTTAAGLGEAFKNCAASMNASGQDFETTTSLLSMLANQGLKGSEAGTVLTATMRDMTHHMTKVKDETKLAQYEADGYASSTGNLNDLLGKNIITIGKMAIPVEDANGNFRDLTDILKDVEKATDGMGSAQKTAALSSVFMAESVKGVNMILNSGVDEAADFEEQLRGASVTLDGFEEEAGSMGIPMDELKQKLEAAGVSSDDFADALKYSGGSAEDFKLILSEGAKSSKDVQKAFDDLGISTEDLQTAMDNSSGSAKNMADVMNDNLSGDMTALNSKIEGVQISLYEKFEPALRAGVDALSKLLDAVNWIIDNGAEVTAVIVGLGTAIGTYAAIVNAAAIKTAILTGATNVLTAAQTALNFVMNMNPIGLVIAAVVGLVAAFVILWKKSEKFRNFWIGLWEKIKEVAGFAWEALKEVFTNIAEFWVEIWSGIKEKASEIWTSITEFFVKAGEKIKEAWNSVKEFFSSIWEGIKEIFSVVAQWIYDNVFQPIIEFFQPVIDFFTTAWNIIKELAIGCWELIKIAWQIAKDWFNEKVIEPVKEFFTKLWNAIKEKASAAWEGIKKVWTVVKTWFNNNVIAPVEDFFVFLWDGIKEGASTAWTKIKEIWNKVSGWFNKNIITPVKDFFKGMWDKLKSGAKDAWTGIKEVFGKVAEWFEEKFRKAWEKVKAVFSTGGKIFDGIKDGIVSAFKTVVNAIIRGINKVIAIPFNAINNTLDRIRDIEIAGYSPFSGLISRFDVPQIPELAKGGVLKKGQKGFLEGDGAEAVVPLEKNTKWLDEIANRLYNKMDLSNQLASVGPQTTNVTNNFYQTNNSPKALSRLEIYRQSKNLLRMKR